MPKQGFRSIKGGIPHLSIRNVFFLIPLNAFLKSNSYTYMLDFFLINDRLDQNKLKKIQHLCKIQKI